MDLDSLIFNIGVFIAGVYVLDYGADTFIDHTVIVGRSLGLAVVVAAILQHRTPLALGNLMGSSISNVLGAFSLGLLFHPTQIDFDRSAKIYAAVLFAVTTLFVVLAFFNQLNEIVGGFLIALFGIYVMSILYAIYKGVATAPELSDSDSDSDAGSTDHVVDSVTEATPLIESQSDQIPERSTTSLLYHVTKLSLGLIALSLAGYLLSHSAVSIADSLHLSGTVFGLTIVSFATTLPEKLIAVVSGSRGHVNIMAATTAGSNIFLLTLCAGVVALAGNTRNQSDTFVLFDLISVWVSSLGFFLVVILGPGRIAGVIFLAAYLAFLALEFTVYRR
ncbi:hypothetical protein Aspvir_001709 [Aspergillus viridinutans]|uniref:Sodium/calcium exchanger membrane region domain-containing protein n=1 Tax=Aspergillus viridinutans TaxID=75553 RepID=A0A9P3F2Z2_ASPVI|nr:uncharacterized protein Aspvir_001709 [Aspergillus viridinutans]GIJ99575.1 hypothetical protein Aspvir_001709 [Aspergillus viridinutans]